MPSKVDESGVHLTGQGQPCFGRAGSLLSKIIVFKLVIGIAMVFTWYGALS